MSNTSESDIEKIFEIIISPVEGGLGDCGVGVPILERLQRSASSHDSSAKEISFSSKQTSASSLKHDEFGMCTRVEKQNG